MIVEDEGVIALGLKATLEDLGYTVSGIAATCNDAVTRAAHDRPDLILMDIRLRGRGDGVEAAKRIHDTMRVPIVYLTAYSDEETIEHGRGANAVGYIVKPYGSRELRATIEIALEHHGRDEVVHRALEQGRARNRVLERVVDAMPAIFSMKDAAGRFMLVNRQFETAFGVHRADVLGRTPLEVFGDAAIASVGYDEASVQNGSVMIMMDERPSAGAPPGGDEKRRYVCISFAVPQGDDEPAAVVNLCTDVTDVPLSRDEIARLNRVVEERVEARTRAVRESVQDLEAFTQTLSHDLRGPIRGIEMLTAAFLEEYGDTADPAAQGYLSRLHRESGRISSLITDLVTLVRIGRGSRTATRVDVTGLAHEIASELRDREPESPIDVQVEPGLVVEGDAALVRVILENLLGNAWKYSRSGRSGTDSATIEVGAFAESGEHVFFVRDNGIGFDSVRDAARLFRPFERLAGSETYSGTGLGLYSARRAVEQQGGRIWADSRPGEGATFYFTVEPTDVRPGAGLAVLEEERVG